MHPSLITMLSVSAKGERLLGDSFLEPIERRTPLIVSCRVKPTTGARAC